MVLSILGFGGAERIASYAKVLTIENADDLIEPFRAIVDGTKLNLISAIELMSESYKRILMHESEEQLALPVILPVESMEGISI